MCSGGVFIGLFKNEVYNLKICKKWSYLLLLLVCGACVLTVTDSWTAVGASGRNAGEWLVAVGNTVVSKVKDYAGVSIPALGEVAEMEGSRNQAGDIEVADGQSQAGDRQVEELNQPGDVQASGVQNQTGEDTLQNGPAEGDTPEVTYRDPSEVVYTTVEDDYFSDAVFIGDSRTVGLFEYGGLEEVTTFYASTGLTIFKMFESKMIEVPDRKEKITIEQALSERQFSKIYLMLGINEMGRGDLEGFLTQYSQVITHLKELQPDAIIYLQGIMKVTSKRSAQGDYISNAGIEERNAGIAALADNVKVYYLDVNPLICDETGGMEPSYTTDGVHLKAQYIPMWKDFLKQHAVVLD